MNSLNSCALQSTHYQKFSKTSLASSMMEVQELDFPAAPWVTFKPNAWKAVQKQLHFPLLSFSVETVPDTTSALLGTKETGKVTAEHPEDEQTVKESALCADLCAAWLNFGVNIVIVCAPHGGKAQWSICTLLLQLCSLSCKPCARAACRDSDTVEVCVCL